MKSVRINGNYFERFIYSTLPFIIISGIIFYLFKKPPVLVILLSISFFSAILFLLDKFPLRKTRLLKVIATNDKLIIDGRNININDITFIRPFKTPPPQSLSILEIYLTDNSCLKFMDKPKPFFYKAKNDLNSKSLDILFSKQPRLKSKLRSQNNYKSF